MKSIILLISTILIGSCTIMNFNGAIKESTTINGYLAVNTVLEVLEEYSEKGNTLPKGLYYPVYESTGGYIVYRYPEKIDVKSLWYSDKCTGGIAVKINELTNYFISVQHCLGEPNLRIDIPKTLKFVIKEK